MKNDDKQWRTVTAILLVIFLACGLVGSLDYEDGLREDCGQGVVKACRELGVAMGEDGVREGEL